MFKIGDYVTMSSGHVGRIVKVLPGDQYRIKSYKYFINAWGYELKPVKYAPGDKVAINGREGTLTIKRVSRNFAFIDKKDTRTPFDWPIPYSWLRQPSKTEAYLDMLLK